MTKRIAKQLSLFQASETTTKTMRLCKRHRRVPLGRRPRADRVGFVPHSTRETHEARCPVHVSIRRVKLAPSFRSELVYTAIVQQLARAKAKGVRVVHKSIQHDHIHLIIEGHDRHDLSAQMCRLFSRIALTVNRIAHRRGSLFRDRHHRVELTSPTQTRNALVYVLFNDRKHDAQNGGELTRLASSLDDRSSVGWVTEWSPSSRPTPDELQRLRALDLDRTFGQSPLTPPRTWLARVGWSLRGGGPLRLSEFPRLR